MIKIRATEIEGRVFVSVIDDGMGIDPRKIDMIFKPFSTTKGELGTGVGLPVTQKILREHGGEVKVTSTLGHGSSFSLILPARRAARLESGENGPDTGHSQKVRPSDTSH